MKVVKMKVTYTVEVEDDYEENIGYSRETRLQDRAIECIEKNPDHFYNDVCDVTTEIVDEWEEIT